MELNSRMCIPAIALFAALAIRVPSTAQEPTASQELIPAALDGTPLDIYLEKTVCVDKTGASVPCSKSLFGIDMQVSKAVLTWAYTITGGGGIYICAGAVDKLAMPCDKQTKPSDIIALLQFVADEKTLILYKKNFPVIMGTIRSLQVGHLYDEVLGMDKGLVPLTNLTFTMYRYPTPRFMNTPSRVFVFCHKGRAMVGPEDETDYETEESPPLSW